MTYTGYFMSLWLSPFHFQLLGVFGTAEWCDIPYSTNIIKYLKFCLSDMNVVHERDITRFPYNSRDHNTVVNRTWVQITRQLYSLSRNSSRTRFCQHFLPTQSPKTDTSVTGYVLGCHYYFTSYLKT